MASHHIPRTHNERGFPDTSDEGYDPIAAAADSQHKQEAKLHQMQQAMLTPSRSTSQRGGGSGSETYSDMYSDISFLDSGNAELRCMGSSRSSPASSVNSSFSDDELSSDARPQLGHSPELDQYAGTPPDFRLRILRAQPSLSAAGSAVNTESTYFGLFPEANASDSASTSSGSSQQQWEAVQAEPLTVDRSPNPYLGSELQAQSLEAQTQALNSTMLLSGSR